MDSFATSAASTFDSSYGEHSEFIDELTSGRQDFKSGISKYVCHTSTIPLASTMDLLNLRMKKDICHFVKENHEMEHDDCKLCSRNYCMFTTANRERRNSHLLRPNCPCLDIKEGNLSPLCFLSFLKTLNYNLVNDKQEIKPDEVMFCLDNENMFSNKYSVEVSEEVGCSGFGHVKKHNLLNLLNRLYWFRKNKKQLQLEKLIKEKLEKMKFRKLIGCLKQTIHTINNLIIKKIDCLGPEITSYSLIASQTSYLFRDLFLEYTAGTESDIPERASPPVFRETKNFFNYVKEKHEHSDLNVRLSILTYKFENRAIKRFFGTELGRLRNYITKKTGEGLFDYTQSLAWDYRMTMLCQTRSLGYLPHYLVREKAKEFWDQVSPKQEPLTQLKIRQISKLVFDELSINKIERNVLVKEQEVYKKIIRDSVLIELKYTASTTQTISSGGKLEDARQILNALRKESTRIPIRDLETFQITGFTPKLISAIDDIEAINISSILFWFSLQTMINHLTEKGKWPPGDTFVLPQSLERFTKEIFHCKLICINEPGKARMLVKSMSNFNWFLTPGAKISQEILKTLPDHKAGLSLGSHDWQHAKRISGESAESQFMYDTYTGKLKKNVIMGFLDWTVATDTMNRECGIHHLMSFWGYIGFPKSYAQLIAVSLLQEQPAEETISDEDEDGSINKYLLKGTIREGFMMGNQMTKTILHLSHVSQRNLVEKYLNSKGITVERVKPGIRVKPYSRLRREAEESQLAIF